MRSNLALVDKDCSNFQCAILFSYVLITLQDWESLTLIPNLFCFWRKPTTKMLHDRKVTWKKV
jgi:hypothetical protein